MVETPSKPVTRFAVPLDVLADVLGALLVMREVYNGARRTEIHDVLSATGVSARVQFYVLQVIRAAALGSPEPGPLIAWWSAASEDEIRDMLDRACAGVRRG